jgi:hypothetical protein
MQVLHPNEEQFNKLNNFKTNSSKLEFVKDNSGKWIVGIEILNDAKFVEIHQQLLELEQIDYTPFIDTI